MTNTPRVTHCKQRHEYTPENTRYRTDGRRMCKTCTDYCTQGHKMTPENTYIRPNGTRSCRECNRIILRRRKRGCQHGVYPASGCMECRYSQSVKASLRRGGEPKSYEEFLGTKDPLGYLALTPEQARASDAFNFAVDTKGRPLCENPVKRQIEGRVVDYYPHADFDTEQPPSVVEAAKMCMGCPVFDACASLGKGLNAGKSKSDGVYAGRVYVDGKLLNK